MGHICNNKELFTDELVPSIYEVGSATGISTPTLMGTVTLRITDYEGAKHSFILKNVNYLPTHQSIYYPFVVLWNYILMTQDILIALELESVLAMIVILYIGTVRGSAKHFIPLHLVFQNVFSVLVILNWMYFPR